MKFGGDVRCESKPQTTSLMVALKEESGSSWVKCGRYEALRLILPAENSHLSPVCNSLWPGASEQDS